MKNSRRNLEKVARLAEATSGKKPKVSKYALKANPRLAMEEYGKAFWAINNWDRSNENH